MAGAAAFLSTSRIEGLAVMDRVGAKAGVLNANRPADVELVEPGRIVTTTTFKGVRIRVEVVDEDMAEWENALPPKPGPAGDGNHWVICRSSRFGQLAREIRRASATAYDLFRRSH